MVLPTILSSDPPARKNAISLFAITERYRDNILSLGTDSECSGCYLGVSANFMVD